MKKLLDELQKHPGKVPVTVKISRSVKGER